MSDITTRPKTKDDIKVERPRLYKVILVDDNYTPQEFVVTVLNAEFRMGEDQVLRVMLTAHRRGTCVVAVYTKDVADAKAGYAGTPGARLLHRVQRQRRNRRERAWHNCYAFLPART